MLWKDNTRRVCQNLTLYGFALYIAAMPVSTAMVNLGALVALAGLLGSLVREKKESPLYAFPFYGFLLLFVGCLVFSCVISQFPAESWKALRSSWHRNFPMILIATAAMAPKKSLYVMLGVFAFTGFYEGMDGIYQYATGADLFRNAPPLDGRLTGSFSTPRVGSLMAMLVCPTLTLPLLLPGSWSPVKRWGLSALLWFPPLFLLVLSQNRTGMICVILSLSALIFMVRGFSRKKAIIFAVAFIAGIAALLLFGPQRFNARTVLSDGRIQELWPFAWEVFKAHPIFGSGLYTYNSAFSSLGLVPIRHSPEIMHPHNIYLQLLAETGIIGLFLFLAFAGSVILRTAKRVRDGLRGGRNRSHWLATAGFWSVTVGYMGMGLTGHDLLRSWWFGMAMAVFGITIGACLKTQAEQDQLPQPAGKADARRARRNSGAARQEAAKAKNMPNGRGI